jgi:nucleotide-binding universal stress UspA family protein
MAWNGGRLHRADAPIAQDLVAEARAEVQGLVNQATGIAPQTSPPMPVEIDVTTGRPARVLLNAAQDADLLVLGHCGRGTPVGALLGSVGLQCVLHAPSPVTIVRARPTGAGSAAGPPARPT